MPTNAEEVAPAIAKIARKPAAKAKAKRAKKPRRRQMTSELATKWSFELVGDKPFDSVAFLRTLR